MISLFKSFINDNHLFAAEDKILLAVSGGMDSVAMAELFREAGCKYAMIHCNFKLRGADSDEDELFVRKLAKEHKVPCYFRSFNTSEIAEVNGESIQMTARDLRYEFFEEIASAYGYDHIAIAHHLDDQNETFFINLLRGSGIAGLHGIKIRKGKVIRPLMFAYRKDIEDFIKANDLSFREDKSNQSIKYLRNKIRHELMPVFLEMNPGFREEMTANINRLSETEKIFRQAVKKEKERIVSFKEDITSLDIAGLKELEPMPSFLYEIISDFGFSYNDVKNIVPALDGISGKTFLSSSHKMIIDREKILIIPRVIEESDDIEYLIEESQSQINEPLSLTFSCFDGLRYSIPKTKQIASIDRSLLSFPLTLRRWCKGDLFVPLGMKNRKKLSDYFIDEKFSIIQKERTWVLCSGKDIVWIVGERIDDRYKVMPDTEKIFQIKLA